ncbi:unnamed protein product [Parnassius apollo]|uniref:(apollo) hypothetical protein n=1 Tax=Parnassius apollo TaxID=110799 RepID=A0A8S3Y1C2_PARAO|nr:unnamed protein product [Parnassius apollo]
MILTCLQIETINSSKQSPKSVPRDRDAINNSTISYDAMMACVRKQPRRKRRLRTEMDDINIQWECQSTVDASAEETVSIKMGLIKVPTESATRVSTSSPNSSREQIVVDMNDFSPDVSIVECSPPVPFLILNNSAEAPACSQGQCGQHCLSDQSLLKITLAEDCPCTKIKQSPVNKKQSKVQFLGKGRGTSGLRSHLKSRHEVEYAEYEQKDTAIKKAAVDKRKLSEETPLQQAKRQVTLQKALQTVYRHQYWDTSHEKKLRAG